jgi:hypothetical protein
MVKQQLHWDGLPSPSYRYEADVVVVGVVVRCPGDRSRLNCRLIKISVNFIQRVTFEIPTTLRDTEDTQTRAMWLKHVDETRN